MKVKSVCASQSVSLTVLDSVNIEWLIVTTQDNVSKSSEFYRWKFKNHDHGKKVRFQRLKSYTQSTDSARHRPKCFQILTHLILQTFLKGRHRSLLGWWATAPGSEPRQSDSRVFLLTISLRSHARGGPTSSRKPSVYPQSRFVACCLSSHPAGTPSIAPNIDWSPAAMLWRGPGWTTSQGGALWRDAPANEATLDIPAPAELPAKLPAAGLGSGETSQNHQQSPSQRMGLWENHKSLLF